MVYPYDYGDINPETHLSWNRERAVRRFFWFEFEVSLDLMDCTSVIEGVESQDYEFEAFRQWTNPDGETILTFEFPGDVQKDHAFRRLVLSITNADPEFGSIYKGELE